MCHIRRQFLQATLCIKQYMLRQRCRQNGPMWWIFKTILYVVVMLIFDFLTSKSNQFIFFKCTKVINVVKFRHAVYKISCLKRPTGRPRSKWLDQIRSDNNLPIGWLMEICCPSRSFRGDATVPVGYAMTTTDAWTNEQPETSWLHQDWCADAFKIYIHSNSVDFSVVSVLQRSSAFLQTTFCKEENANVVVCMS